MNKKGFSGQRAALAVLLLFAAALLIATLHRQWQGRQLAPTVADSGSVQIAPADADAAATDDPATTRRRESAREAGRFTPGDQAGIKALAESRERMRAEQERQFKRAQAGIAATFNSEPVDPAWSAPAESELRRIAANAESASEDIEAEDVAVACKKTTCRLTASFATGGKADDWTTRFMSSVGGALKSSAVSQTRNPDGSVLLEIYSNAR